MERNKEIRKTKEIFPVGQLPQEEACSAEQPPQKEANKHAEETDRQPERKPDRKPAAWEDLGISNDFLFGKVMQDPELCKGSCRNYK